MKKLIIVVFLFLIINSLHSQVPGIPIIISPSDSATLCPPYLFDWNDVPTATSYEIMFSLNQSFTQIVVDQNLTESQYILPNGILSSSSYSYWRVRAINSYGNGQWTAVRRVKVNALTNPPVLITPPNGSVGTLTNVTFDWNAVPGATSYILQISKSPLFDTLVVCDTTPLGTITLQYSTTYYWRVCGMNQCGAGNWSTVFNFTTVEQVPLPPVLLSPADSSTIPVNGQIFDWSDVPGSNTYRIQISISPVFSTTEVNQIITVSQFTIPSSILQNSTLYYWRVAAINAGGQGSFSSVWKVITQAALLPAPVIYPLNRGKPVYADSSTIFEWRKMLTATSYRIQISTTISFLNPINEIVYDSLYIAPPNTFSNNTTYYWRVAAINNAGQGNWSAVWSFTVMPSTPVPPNLLYPLNNSVNISLTPMLNWSDATGATSYRIHLSTSPPIDTIVALSEYAVPPGKLNYYTTYYWRIASINISGQGQFSTLWNFQTINQIGIKQISSEIPAEYKLFNNYPNPFNPSTNIRYQITDNKFTTVKIFDILGREVKTLVSEFQKAGIYEIQFSFDGFESGIYFYRLQSGDFIDTKKMLMIK